MRFPQGLRNCLYITQIYDLLLKGACSVFVIFLIMASVSDTENGFTLIQLVFGFIFEGPIFLSGIIIIIGLKALKSELPSLLD